MDCRRGIACLSVLIGALLSACGSAPPPRKTVTPVPRTAPPAPATCNTVPAQFAVGQFANPGLLEKARAAAQADFARVVRNDQVLTQELRAGRLNLHVDAGGKVQRVSCG